MTIVSQYHDFVPPHRLLMGPGPSMVHPRVLHALSLPLLGHLDPLFLGLMNDIQALLRTTFQTGNEVTSALSGTGSAGMEAVITNLIEPGDRAIVGVNGVFGSRLAMMVERAGGTALRIEAPWGTTIPLDLLQDRLSHSAPVKAVVLVQAETSTGAWQPLSEIGTLCRTHDAPLTLSPHALDVIRHRRTPCRSWYLDLSLIADYWSDQTRAYHHTAPISMLYGLREALRLVQEEGLETRFARHQLNSDALLAGLRTLDLVPLPPIGHRLPTLNCVTLPDRLDDQTVRTRLLNDHGIEIGGGLGPLHGRVWRIGLMGESCRQAYVLTLLNALEDILARNGRLSQPGCAVQAAVETYTYSQTSARRSA